MLCPIKLNIQLLILCILFINTTTSSNVFVKLLNSSLNQQSGLSTSSKGKNIEKDNITDVLISNDNKKAQETRKKLQCQGIGHIIKEQSQARRASLLNVGYTMVNKQISKKCIKIDDLDCKYLAIEIAKHNKYFRDECLNLHYIQNTNMVITRNRTPDEPLKRGAFNSADPDSLDRITAVLQELIEKLIFSKSVKNSFFSDNIAILWNSLELSFAKHKLNNDIPNIMSPDYVLEKTRLNYDCSFLLYLEILCDFMTTKLKLEEYRFGVFPGAHSFLLLSAIRMLIPSYKSEEVSMSFINSLNVMPFESQDNWKKHADYFFTSCIYLRYYLYLDYKESINSINVTGNPQDPFLLYYISTTTFDMLETFINLSLNYNNIVNDKEIKFYTIDQDKIEDLTLGTGLMVLDDWLSQLVPVIKFESNLSTDAVLFKLFSSLINIQQLPINFIIKNFY